MPKYKKKVYTPRMKVKQNLFSWLIVLIALPLLFFLAWNQFNWLEELQKRERFRIENTMIESVQEVSKRLREELLFLPSLLHFRYENQILFEKSFAERWQFWTYYAESSSIINQIYLFIPETNEYKKWTGSQFIQETNPQDIFFNGRISETKNTITISINSFVEQGPKPTIFCVFNKNEIFNTLIPNIADHSFSDSSSFSYRIINTATNKILWSNSDIENVNKHINQKKPDYETLLVRNIQIPFFQQSPNFSARIFIDGDKNSFTFIKERPRTEIEVAPDKSSDEIPDHIFSTLLLQIYNNDGSLAELAQKASIQNALLSFGSVLLLFFIIILLARTGQKARRLAESQKEFIATITHELKTPLAVITSAAQNLSDGIIKEQKKAEQYGGIIQKEASRLGISIEHFLLYSRTGSNSRIKPEPINISDFIQTVLKFSESERQALSFRTEVSLPENPLFINGDKIALESVFQNLIQNVLIHAKEGKYIGILVSIQKNKKNKQNTVQIKIRDKGPGISPKEQKHIFEPFVRGKQAHDMQIPGNGIGLNLVQRILVMHNGNITIESKLGNGCIFTLSLPIMQGVSNG